MAEDFKVILKKSNGKRVEITRTFESEPRLGDGLVHDDEGFEVELVVTNTVGHDKSVVYAKSTGRV
ncbi:hypothetical protein [Ruegeria arenilitoris]|uniref:hypothetical protein n=1 Tax=Ruegeria arenilitoris TaxID=1173585 RepID=UPI001480D33D|nr:hypothetical protein [Ruegeria arenilitoris]